MKKSSKKRLHGRYLDDFVTNSDDSFIRLPKIIFSLQQEMKTYSHSLETVTRISGKKTKPSK